ncbi:MULTISPECIES: AAA family ATPase [Psychrobacter]|jgi:predicted ATP-binding protein involved in virulence|uniref:AAA family ATPase n=1 Tax=Psychrobacter TaxID=497 RepID=UPI000EE33AE0|nr:MULTISPECIES: AAA family ATPase [Psychrobacter]HCN17903.1 ATP-binding protein [Psychrobacter sp.]
MKVKRLHLQNYGRFEDLKIDFAPTAEKTGNVTVIVGNNGAGKSQILQALATSLSWFVLKLVSDTDGFEIDKAIIKNGKNDVEVNVLVDFGENNPRPYGPIEDAYWTISNVKDGRINSFNNSMKELKKTVRNFQSNLTNKHNYSLPLIAFYTVDRTALVKSQADTSNKSYEQLEGYEDGLNFNSINFSNFLSWFRNAEDIENETKNLNYNSEDMQDKIEYLMKNLSSLSNKVSQTKDPKEFELLKNRVQEYLVEVSELQEIFQSYSRNSEYQGRRILSPIRESITRFTNFENIHIRRQGTPTMIVEKNGEELDVNQLSQGEKSLLALVGDIARRLALLNPSLDNPLEGEGVVMIDEVDLHLHPKWQHDLIDKLVATFPNVQFILTTHSPHVISDRNDILLYSLDDGELTEMPNVYGEDANTVLTKIFDVDIRDSKVEEQFNVIRRAISKHDYLTAENYITELAEKLPSDHLELLKCRLLLAQSKLANNDTDESSHAED